MAKVKETSLLTYRFLGESYFTELHETFLEAFTDYVVPFQLSQKQLRVHILNNGIDLELSVGCFAGRKMAGFTLNGFGTWNGKFTAYDAGTGVIPEFRRRGASRAMFEFMLPVMLRRGVRQCLLEVITNNEKAINLYRGLGFEQTRRLLVLRAAQLTQAEGEFPAGMTIREISRPDWKKLQTFWDGRPSWQNSPEAIERISDIRNTLGAFLKNKCVGYMNFSDSGNIVQLAVDKDHRGRGIGSSLLAQMPGRAKKDKPLQVINLDEALTGTLRFLQNRGFAESLSQYEMLKTF